MLLLLLLLLLPLPAGPVVNVVVAVFAICGGGGECARAYILPLLCFCGCYFALVVAVTTVLLVHLLFPLSVNHLPEVPSTITDNRKLELEHFGFQ